MILAFLAFFGAGDLYVFHAAACQHVDRDLGGVTIHKFICGVSEWR